MNWFQKQTRLAYFSSKRIIIQDKWIRLREIAKEKDHQVQVKLEWIIFYHTTGNENATFTSNYFGIARKTFHKWLSRFIQHNLIGLEEISRAPHVRRSWEVTRCQEERILSLRKQYLKYGKHKLKVLYVQRYQEQITTWKIERVIRRYQLYADPNTAKKRVQRIRKAKQVKRITEIAKPTTFGHLWHIDAIIIWWYGARRIIFTAIEELTKIGYARVYGSNASIHAADFLKRLNYLVEGKVDLSHQDNGSEFKGKFELACHELSIQQVYSRVRTPTDNASLERFNWTVQDEWLSLSETGLDDINQANHDLTEWLVEYNFHRPHQSLDYQTPFGYAQENFFKVLPMWSASSGT